ncbi:hypothetical protein [Niabella digestorum]|uniref:Lipocalin-like domain-containing protein n=1 Tax=Niabella digestorum TaxID=3117701 RepID=A0ABU7RDR8_9BACT
MNKLQFLRLSLFVVILGLSACSTSKSAIAPRKDFVGNWEIISVRVEGAEGKLNITAFDDADLNCFRGSTWYLPSNGYGSYTINNGECPSGARQILWSQRVNGGATLFNFKKMDGVRKKDSKDILEGYSLEVTSFEGNSFTLRSPVLFEGKTIYIVYEFSRR